MITCWKGTDGLTEPKECQCEVFGYPHRTTEDEMMFINTHFLEIEKAWESIMRSVEVEVKFYGREVADMRESLRKSEERAAKAAERFAAAHDKHFDWNLSKRS